MSKYWTNKPELTNRFGTGDNDKFRIATLDGEELFFSKHDKIPEVGDLVKCRDEFGKARVMGYFTEDKFLGVIVKPEKLPAWFVKQEREAALAGKHGEGYPFRDNTIGIFGAEFSLVD